MKKKQNKFSKTQEKKEGKFSGLKPLGDRVLIKEEVEKEEKTDFGLYIPETAKEDKGTKKGKIVAVGEGKVEEGKIVPIKVRVGDEVLFQWGDRIIFKKNEYYVVRESEIVAIVK